MQPGSEHIFPHATLFNAANKLKLDPQFAAAGYDATLPAYSQEGFASDQGMRNMLEIVTNKKVGEFSPSRLADFSFLREALAELKAGK